MKRYKIFFGVLLLFLFSLSVLNFVCEKGAYFTPDYDKKDISYVFENEITDDEYIFLREQTGLSKTAVDNILKEENAKELLKDFQKQNFTKHNFKCKYLFFPVTKEERITGDGNNARLSLPKLKDGDILITKSTHTLFFRHGHVGLVTDSDSGEILEAMCLGTHSLYNDISKWEKYPCLAVLRPKNLSEEKIAEVVKFAKYKLFDKRYSFTAGFFENDEEIARTHCSHLVWKAYESVGINLDSDGGLLVLPDDILNSDELEIIWSYGINTKK